MENQCKGTTKAGVRCKVKNGLKNGYCRLHQDQATIKKGKKNRESMSSPKSKPINNEAFPDTEIIDTNPNPETDENKLSKARIIIISIIIIMILLIFSKITEKNK